jgi:site-specific DNA-cytosine methylase
MTKIRNVLSLFDGMSCGQLALEKAGVTFNEYYASEIDPWAIQVAKNNFPDTVHLGDVTELESRYFTDVDLLIGGTPCQSFSNAGDGTGFDGSSKLFWEYVRLLKEIKPKYFLLENVVMRQEWQDIISEAVGVQPIAINSKLLSAQNRPRLYWTNIPNIEQPEDLGLTLSDILEDEVEDKYYLSDKAIDYMSRLRNGKPRWEYHKNPTDGKAACLTANMYKGVPYGVLKLDSCDQVATLDMKASDSIKRVYGRNGKAPCLTTMGGGHREPKVFDSDRMIARKLTPLECERLQTLPDDYTKGVSNTQRYKMIGNGWTADVIAHIFKNIK